MQHDSRWEIRLKRDARSAVQKLISQEFSSGERSGNSEAFVPGCEIQKFVIWMRADERQFVRSSSAKAGPGANGLQAANSRQVFDSTGEHFGKNFRFDSRIAGSVLARRPD